MFVPASHLHMDLELIGCCKSFIAGRVHLLLWWEQKTAMNKEGNGTVDQNPIHQPDLKRVKLKTPSSELLVTSDTHPRSDGQLTGANPGTTWKGLCY